ncbi:MAG: glycosyltransferase family 2 protein [Clostridia bacterium]|nr:glycosyltransferase family 2 protein [Clostridia bacterium]
MEKVNILMATYNGRRYVAKQIESILNQTYQDFRLIISDDCSTDSTLKILEEYEAKDNRIEIFHQGENLGVVANFEFLIGRVRSEYFMFADQDDIWEPDKIEKSVKKLEEEHLDLVYTDLAVVDSRLHEIAPSYWRLKGLDYRIKKYNNFESLYLNNFVTGCTMLVRSKWINEFMPLPKESKYVLHDYWISLMVSQKGRIGYIDEPTMKYRQHKDNKIGSKTRSEQMSTLDDVRNLFITVKIEHFTVFIKNQTKFQSKSVQELSQKALKYYEDLKAVKKFTLKGITLFLKLYKYESFDYKIKNLAILHFPGIARPYFKKQKEKRELEESLKRKEELEAKIERKKKAKERKEEKLRKEEARNKRRLEKEKKEKTKAKENKNR